MTGTTTYATPFLFGRELSQGFFSDDNQKKLVGQDNEVPIFEAKMTRDLRLVYQVECGAHVMGEADPSKPKYEKQRKWCSSYLMCTTHSSLTSHLLFWVAFSLGP